MDQDKDTKPPCGKPQPASQEPDTEAGGLYAGSFCDRVPYGKDIPPDQEDIPLE